jgi:hypothetical protein
MSDEIPNCPKYKDDMEGRQQSCDDAKTFVEHFPSDRVKGVCVIEHVALAVGLLCSLCDVCHDVLLLYSWSREANCCCVIVVKSSSGFCKT